jgi:hypothetical protein
MLDIKRSEKMITEIEIREKYVSVFISTNKDTSYVVSMHGDTLKEDTFSYEIYDKGLYVGRIYKVKRNKIIITREY